MASLFGGMPHCKRCKLELDGSESVCPRCQFSPRQKGLRVAGIGLFVMVSAVIGAQISLLSGAGIGLYLLGIAGVAFAFAFAMFFVSMVVTPYRFGELFIRR